MGNLVVAGGQDLRVFEIREEAAPVQEQGDVDDGPVGNGSGPPLDEMGDSFFDSAPADVSRNLCIRVNNNSLSVLLVRDYREHLFDTKRQEDCTSLRVTSSMDV